ncbi:MAG TPA: hypothetical protein VHZ78_01995 [Rhizomicrobium sp.]|jgi:hypothetical protein|nr:hypothetical protein [Rhizomicrobium sp.]
MISARPFRKLPALIAAALLMLTSAAIAGDHLLPEDPALSDENDFDGILYGVFKDLYTPDYPARMIAVQSFQREFAVALHVKDGRYSIVLLDPPTMLWGYQVLADDIRQRDQDLAAGRDARADVKEIADLEVGMPSPDWRTVKPARCERPIDAALGAQLVEDWRAMLLQTRFAQPEPVASESVFVDGDILHFSTWGGGMAGQITTPSNDGGDKTNLLIAIGFAMRDYCKTGDAKQRATIVQAAADLAARLKQDG